MNEPRTAGRPAHAPNRSRRSNHRRRRRRQNRRFQLFLLVHQLVLVLLALAIGYFIGIHAASSEAEPTLPPSSADLPGQVQEPQTPQPSEAPGDTTAPKILGANNLSVFLGSTVAYRSGILVTDDTDPTPRLSVDSSQVDLSTPGTYPLFYSATDSAGNVATVKTTITVAEAPESYVAEGLILERADKLLAELLTDGMTREEQVNAIYDWIESHCYYIADFDKTDYMQAAYLMMTNNRGDCFGFYALSRLLFDRLGLENLTVTRLPNEVRTSRHWWNMVSLDDGETWYHFDATPHMTYPTRTCLVTDADLEAFNQLMPNYYFYDHASFPKTPAA